ncbi:E3 ubiquitin-protein ligase RNF181 isoform X2 [Eurytemora carolleeae]|uniref:E3 ubiquitin-protein ligase RNF181 isoform X2 n=1 Tax=Eurytemora carolleeae TaxID=1294199 RepID=UPI000C783B68|nr:E3 ubiquitin-protein ligase RNF181 isoform X2 [Eurytemora carolleeae]|eukprot:XP_023332637.1 E3 ubiquitin-protein ligase RNF181-like isoform X2 [Eurytemora affinis]
MTSYFEEHNCEPLNDNPNTPDNLLEFARFLILTGNWRDEEFSGLFNERPPPPTSSDFIEKLETMEVSKEETGSSCPICLKGYEAGETISSLPCKHSFHANCLLPWLQKTSSCPLCRAQLNNNVKNTSSSPL